VLKDISFELPRGKALGVIGKNGAGKSTLLQILTGTLTPTTGEVYLRGKVAALLELGSGFNPEFSGRDNIYVNGAILGLTRSQINERFDDIVAFSELGDHIEQPVKTYSSGMYVRLAFSVQVCVNPDILIVDEALAVGDVFFQQKCHARMEKLLEQGTSILLVSHDTSAIRKYCDTSLLLEDGQNIFYGDVETAVSKYFFQRVPNSSSSSPRQERADVISADMKLSDPNSDENKDSKIYFNSVDSPKFENNLLNQWPKASEFIDLKSKEVTGDLESARLMSAALCNKNGIKSTSFAQGEWGYFFWGIQLLRDIEVPIGGLTITSASNLAVYCRCTAQSEQNFPVNAKKNDMLYFQVAVKLDLQFGNYFFTPGLGEMSIADYSQRVDLSINSFFHSLSPIIIATSIEVFTIHEPLEGIKYPFFGIADIPNSCSMLISRNNNKNSIIL
jgi:lipopolysaccharide transport system ATP-binding protein